MEDGDDAVTALLEGQLPPDVLVAPLPPVIASGPLPFSMLGSSVFCVGDLAARERPAVASRIVDFFTGAQQRHAAQVFPELTAREREVRNHVATILTKLQAPDRVAAVAKARDAGIGRESIGPAYQEA